MIWYFKMIYGTVRIMVVSFQEKNAVLFYVLNNLYCLEIAA